MEIDWERWLKTIISESCLNLEELKLSRPFLFFFFLKEAMDGLEPESFYVNPRAGRQRGKQGSHTPRKPEEDSWRSKGIDLGFELGLTKSLKMELRLWAMGGGSEVVGDTADIWMTILKWSFLQSRVGCDSSGIILVKAKGFFSTLYRHCCSHRFLDPQSINTSLLIMLRLQEKCSPASG